MGRTNIRACFSKNFSDVQFEANPKRRRTEVLKTMKTVRENLRSSKIAVLTPDIILKIDIGGGATRADS